MIHFDQGEGLHREARGSDVWFKALSMDTNGRFSFMERTLPPTGRMPPPRRHANNDEAYFVLEGVVEFRVGEDVVTGASGTFMLVEAGEAYTFGNTSDEPARLARVRAGRLLRRVSAVVGCTRGAKSKRRAGTDATPRHRAGVMPATKRYQTAMRGDARKGRRGN